MKIILCVCDHDERTAYVSNWKSDTEIYSGAVPLAFQLVVLKKKCKFMKKLQDIGMHLQIETWKRTAKVN